MEKHVRLKEHFQKYLTQPTKETLWFYEIFPPSQNISKNEPKKLDAFGSKFGPNTFTFIDQLLLIFCDGGSMLLWHINSYTGMTLWYYCHFNP
jgi:hypothetical protein